MWETYRTPPVCVQLVNLHWIATLHSTTGPIVAIARVVVVITWLIGITLAPAFAHAFVVTSVLCEIYRFAWSGADRRSCRWKRVDLVGVDTTAGIHGGLQCHVVLLSSKMGARA